jgi:hypothetical protein
MKEILKEILKALQYQTKLMETIYEKKDESRAGSEMVRKQMESMQKIIASTPGINPELAKMIGSIFNTIPGGDQNEH